MAVPDQKYFSRITGFSCLVFMISFFSAVKCLSGIPEQVKGLSVTSSILIYGTPSLEKDVSGMPLSVTVPLRRVGRLFLIEARIDDQTGNLVFDSGSSKIVLNRTYFRKYQVISDDEGGGLTGTTGRITRTNVSRIQISELSFQSVTADVLDLGHIENRRGVKILGLFGLSLIRNLEIVIDLNHNELHLFRLDKSGNRLDNRYPRPTPDAREKIDEYRNVLFVKASIGGKVLNFCLDTGAETNVLSSYSPKKVMSSITIMRRSELMASGSQGADVLFGTINDFNFAGKKLSNMQTIVTSLQNMSDSFGVTIDGMLGYDFFSQGEICINLMKNEMGINFTKPEKIGEK
jgi:predicted aspartyl protease